MHHVLHADNSVVYGISRRIVIILYCHVVYTSRAPAGCLSCSCLAARKTLGAAPPPTVAFEMARDDDDDDDDGEPLLRSTMDLEESAVVAVDGAVCRGIWFERVAK